MRDDTGAELQADFSVERTDAGFDVILESRGGVKHKASGERRNTDYAPALIILLTRMSGLGLSVQQAWIASSTTANLTPDQRRLDLRDHPYPVSLADLADFEALRLDLGRALAAFRSGPDSQGKGTSAKRLRLSVAGPALSEMSEQEFGQYLAGFGADRTGVQETGRNFAGPSPTPDKVPLWTEPATADPEALAASVRALERKLKSRRMPSSPPPGSSGGRQVIGPAVRYIRDPNIIAWVLETANGHCEVCEQPAPFAREDGSLFLEVHHLRPLAEGGPDKIDNALAACPNCHRRPHHAEDRVAIRVATITRIERLADYPAKPYSRSD